jgi:hypothetical protein
MILSILFMATDNASPAADASRKKVSDKIRRQTQMLNVKM